MARRKRKPSRPRKRRSFLGRMFRVFLKLGFVTVLLWAVIALGYYAWALTFDIKLISDMPQRSAVYDKNGRYYSRLSGENRILVPFDKVSHHFVEALLAREDTRFYSHHGIDPLGIGRAIVRNFIGGGFRQGASTITQQLARNSFPLGGKNLHRKLIEAALAYRIETELTKEEILEAYMNRIYFGSGFYGVEAASQAYFGKPAARLTLSEAATLAGLIRSPNRFSPFNNLDAAVRERNVVLNRMYQLHIIARREMTAALDTRLIVADRSGTSYQDNWAMDSVMRELDLVIDREQFDSGGLKVYTTIDGKMQNAAEDSVRKRLEQIESLPGYRHKTFKALAGEPLPTGGTPYLQAAAIALDNQDGGIRAIVGGRDFDRSKFNRAILGQRQIGSAVKPFVYAKAFESGMRPDEPIDDSRLRPQELPSAFRNYNPDNSDNSYRGMLPAQEGLILSRNTMSVRVGLKAGFDTIADAVTLAGISPNPPRYPALCLGAFESTLKDLTSAYTAFATGGVKLQPYLIEKIVDADGKTIYRATHGRLQVLPEKYARMTSSIMEEVIDRGTAGKARQYGLRHRAAGKTGTTNDYQDAWFVGFDNDITCGVWVGFDTPAKIMTGGTGGELALPIWVDIVEAAR